MKNILIVGQGAVASALAKKLIQYENVEKIYITTQSNIQSEFYENIDIREDDLTGLLKFALEKEIDLTIPTSEKALKADIVSFFLTNAQNIFGPSKEACNIALSNTLGKKFLYRLRALTAKFRIFDKAQMAEDYLTTAKFPVSIKTDEYSSILDDRLVCPTISLATEFISSLFNQNTPNVLIEEFIYGKSFTIYFITDGYSAIELPCVESYKFTQDGDGGILTNGIGCYAPHSKITNLVIEKIKKILSNALSILAQKGSPYVGIIGVEGVLTEDEKFFINEFKPFLQEHDASAVLNLISDDLIKIMEACINGFFADEYNEIKTNNYTSISATVIARQDAKIIKGLNKIEDINNVDFINIDKNDNDKFVTKKGASFTLTRVAGTLAKAKEFLYDDLEQINFDGIKYRKDIGGKCNY